MIIPGRCKETVYPKEQYGSFHGYQCTRKAVKDGYCKIHHPDSVKDRQEEASKRWRERIDNSPEVRLHNALKEIEALKARIRELEAGLIPEPEE